MVPTAEPAARLSVPVPDGFQQLDQIARYQAWLEEAYRIAISASVRGLIAEVSEELSTVSACGLAEGDDFADVIHAAVLSVASALDHESVSGR